jgi:methylenetetrahydrofolate reductase (NADH)
VDWGALQRFCAICGAAIPDKLRHILEPISQNPAAVRKAGIAFTIEFCRQLLEAGAPGIHIYALNRSTAAAEIVTALRISGHLS